MSKPGPYHHGDLRRALLTAAAEVIAEQGPSHLSLRDVARRAGVSHAAPAHHFHDKAGVLTALAAEGYDRLGAALEDALAVRPLDLKELGVAYLRFAADHPAHFEVMFRPDLYHRDDPNLLAARARTGELLRAGLDAVPRSRRGHDQDMAGLAAWLLAHGFASLWRSGSLDAIVDGRDPAEVFRAAAGQLYGGAGEHRVGTLRARGHAARRR
jgi:AcrR family transcriptional regulator